MEDAGRCNEEALSPATAREVAYILGTLKRCAVDEHTLPALVVHCDGDHLQERALDVCSWAIEQSPITTRKNIQHMVMDINQSSFFL